MTNKNTVTGRLGRSFVVTLSIGIVFGFGFAYMILSVNTPSLSQQGNFNYYTTQQRDERQSEQDDDVRLDDHGHAHGDRKDAHTHEDTLHDSTEPKGKVSQHSHDEEMHKNEGLEAELLAKEVRVLCWVMTSPVNHAKKAIHVKNTWGRRCNKLIFMSTKDDEELGSVALPNVKEGRNYLWAKTKEAFRYIYNHHFEDADWFMKADDDTYVVAENLRYMLKDFNSSYPVYFGCKFRPFVKQGYMSGGAGYVLSKEALRRFVKIALPNSKLCRKTHAGNEDVEMGKCMQNVGVDAGDSRDSLGRYRFMPFVPEHHLIPGHVDKKFWYWRYIYYPQSQGLDCCSDTAISFHYVQPNQMYVMDYLIYHMRPYGINHRSNSQSTSILPSSTSEVSTKPMTKQVLMKDTSLTRSLSKVSSPPPPPSVSLIDDPTKNVDDPTKASDWLLSTNDSST